MTKIRWNALLYNACFALNSLLLFLAIFGAQLQVPSWLQVAGRAHPLFLHFPIVLLVLALIWEAKTKNTAAFSSIGDGILLATATTAAISALMGLFLSKEGGYEEKDLLWHQWSGVLVSFLAWGWYAFRDSIRASKKWGVVVSVLSISTLLLAGHQGATLTHGQNYLFAPLSPEIDIPQVSIEDAKIYEHLVRPILKGKCMNCHNSQKAKGELSMETEALLLKGGKNGQLWDSSATSFGLMMDRVHLPAEEKEHMPPKGKAQLTEEEINILYEWIKSGASFTQKVQDLPESAPLRILAEQRLQNQAEAPYPFQAADEATIQKLNNDYRVVAPLNAHSPALSVEFYGISAFNSAYLKDLAPVKEQIVHLNLNKMPVQDADMKVIGTFPNLRKLNLAFSQITGASLGELKGAKSLASLSLSGTAVKGADLAVLQQFSALKELFLWNTAVSEQDLSAVKKQLPNVRIESGFKGEGIVAKLNAPLIEGEVQVFTRFAKVKLKNYIQGAVLRYTLDGSIPDSLSSPIYTGDSITISQSCQLTAKAFLPGWISSDVSIRNYYKNGVIPDSVWLKFSPNPQYKGEGGVTLINQKIGETDFRSNKWLGYKETNLEAFMWFNHPTTLSSVSVSTIIDIGSYIMPAKEIQVWGGKNAQAMVLLKKLNPEQPEKLGMPAYRIGYTCPFAPQQVSVIKIVVKPVGKLPAWHPGKGELGWVFVDEVFIE